jgi:hypothetical protein
LAKSGLRYHLCRKYHRSSDELDPEGAAEYEHNAAAYIEELRELDSWISAEVEKIPEDRRLLVTNHESLGYFADRYGFQGHRQRLSLAPPQALHLPLKTWRLLPGKSRKPARRQYFWRRVQTRAWLSSYPSKPASNCPPLYTAIPPMMVKGQPPLTWI